MIEKFLRFILGYVLISIKGEQNERFLNLCRSKKISMEKIRCQEDLHMTALLSLKDFFKLRPVRSKTKVHIRILEKHGLPFFFYRNKKRKAFFLGLFLCFGIMLLLSSRIWNIHIEGNIKNTTPEILEFLETKGVTHGMAKPDVNCTKIAAMVRKKYPEVTWVSARIEGTRLILTIQEGIMAQHTKEEEMPCNLTADHDGTIVKMITRKGIPLVKPGDTCKKGDPLVSGELHIMNDSQEIVRFEYVHADADIYVKHQHGYYHEFPLKYEAKIPTNKTKKGFFVKAGTFYLELYPKTSKAWRCTASEFPLRITENFVLPFSFGLADFTEYKTIKSVYTKEQAKNIALSKLQLYEEKLLQKGIQISENNVTINITPTSCISKGYLTVIETTGLETPLIQQKAPAEEAAQE